MALLRYKAKWDFKPEEHDELPFVAGDFIDAPAKKTDPNWGTGKNVRTGKKGTFPWNLLEATGTAIDQALPPLPTAPKPGAPAHSYQNFTPTGAPPLAPRTTSVSATRHNSSSTAGRGGSSSAAFASLPWYGGKMAWKEVNSVLGPTPDGTFLVRDSTTRPGNFSLSVKYHDIRHIVIIYRNDKFGFSEPTTFDSIPDLIAYFQRESLAHYNAELETRLEYAFKEAPKMDVRRSGSGSALILPEEDDEEIYMANKKQLRKQLGGKKVQMAEVDDESIAKKIKAVEWEKKATAQMLAMLKDQRKIQDRLLDSSQFQADDENKMQQNLSLLKRRFVDCERNLTLIENQFIEAQTTLEKRAPSMSMSARKAKIIVDEKIDREQAEKLLDGTEDGTYLIRKSNRSNDPYSLSMRFLGKTRHIQIKYDGTRYGFAEPLAFFSLEDLCKYYTDTELSATITKTLTRTLNKSG